MGLQQITIDLVDYMGSDLSTVNSARVSFDKASDWEYDESAGTNNVLKLSAQDTKLIKYLADHRHMTPFRHNQIQLRCTMPIFLARQLGKHQAGLTLNEVSRRYVDAPPEFYTPDEWRCKPDGSIKQGSGKPHRDQDFLQARYKQLLKQCLDEYNGMLLDGVAPEMARIVLPQAMQTTWIWTGNLLAFAHVYKERISQGAQLEAQHFARQLDLVVRPLFHVSWSALIDNKDEQ